VANNRQIIAFYGIGSGSDSSRRYVQFVTPQRGWQGFVQDQIVPMIRQGVRRFLLWMPHGRESKTRKQLVGNQWLSTQLRYDAWRLTQKNLALRWLSTGFAEAFYPLTTNGIEVITYVGTLHGAPEFDKFPKGQVIWDAVKAIAPLIDARCSIALDTSVRSQPGHYVYELTQSLKSGGTKYYLEPTPPVDMPHWFSSPCIVSEVQWANVVQPANHHILAGPNRLTGEIIRGLFQYKPLQFPSINAWYNWTVPSILKAGHTCCLPLGPYFAQGGTLNQLMR
jgi:hypothetical protein